MSDNRKYYYLKLKENFYNSETMVILESMQDGLLYSNLLLKMYLMSLKSGGKRPPLHTPDKALPFALSAAEMRTLVSIRTLMPLRSHFSIP